MKIIIDLDIYDLNINLFKSQKASCTGWEEERNALSSLSGINLSRV